VRWPRQSFQDLRAHLWDAIRSKGWLTQQRLVHGDPKRPNVAAGIDRSARAHLFGRHVDRRSKQGCCFHHRDVFVQHNPRQRNLGDPKVDTISHLPSWDALRSMLASVAAALKPGGQALFATRDHTRVYEGDDRFLLIRADAAQAMTCFVEDAGDRVRVTDIVHRLDVTPHSMTASSYYKLRVSPENLKPAFAAAGIPIRESHALPGGVHVLCATRA
jgi:hypothetical protein